MDRIEELLKTASADLEQLGRVSHRVAMTDSERLERVLDKLLPLLLARIGSNNQNSRNISTLQNDTPEKREALVALKTYYDKIHKKLVELLLHITKRVRSDESCKLPCDAIINLLLDGSDVSSDENSHLNKLNPFTLNLSLAFLTIGVPRCSTEEKESLFPGLITLLGSHTNLTNLASASHKNQCFQLAHLVLRTVEGMVKGKRSQNQTPVLSRTKKQSSSLDDNESNVNIDKARALCESNMRISAAIYDLFLDVLMYQTTPIGSNIPPPGLSTFGRERLNSGASTIEKNWYAEYAVRGRLRDLKLSILDFIAPCRRFDIFNAAGGNDASEGNVLKEARSRAVALMVLATGDPHLDVAEKASSYLKVHMDSLRNKTDSKSSNKDSNTSNAFSSSLLGHPICLALSLLRLVLGDIISDNTIPMEKLKTCKLVSSLGLFQSEENKGKIGSSNNINTNVMVSIKRRMVSEKAISAILTFISTRVLDDNPKVFIAFGQNESSQKTQLNVSSNAAFIIGKMILTVVKKFTGTGVSSPSGHGSLIHSSVAAARLLNSYCLRLVPLYDIHTRFPINEANVENDRLQLEKTLSQCFAVACSIVKIASSSHSGDVTNKTGIETRDSCYQVIGTISRCQLSILDTIFHLGDVISPDLKTSLSINTASMLFGCLINEHECLKPRAISSLDAILAAYIRCVKSPTHLSAFLDETTSDKNAQMSNPWLQMSSDNSDKSDAENRYDFQKLSKLLQPLLWNAAKEERPKASRHAAAKWASKLLKMIDLNAACHILCFISGDKDVISANAAREGLGLKDVNDDLISTEKITPDFADFVSLVLSSEDVDMNTWRPTYWDFSSRGQGVALRYCSICLLNDLYGGDDEAISLYLSRIGETLQTFHGTNSRNDSNSIELLDEAAICLACCFKSSQFARQRVIQSSTFSHQMIAELAVSVTSSKARRYFSTAFGYLLEDRSIWSCNENNGLLNSQRWIEYTQVNTMIRMCFEKLNSLSTTHSSVNEIHGAIYLGSTCIRAVRLLDIEENNDIFRLCSSIISSLGDGLSHSDEVIGNACSNGLSIALSLGNNRDALPLQPLLMDGVCKALNSTCRALKKYGNGDHTDASRANNLSEAAGIMLAVTTVCSSSSSNHDRIGTARLECVEALFSLMGSSSYRKDPEFMLVVGEALALYADAYSPDGATWTYPMQDKPETFESSYANELPPHSQILYILLEREMNANSPHKKNACAPVLLAIVSRVTRLSYTDAFYMNRALPQEVSSKLGDIQTAFLSLLANPKSKQLARECCCIGLSACHGFSVRTKRNTIELNERLWKAFGQTSNHGGSALMESRQQHAQRMQENRQRGSAAASMMEDFGMETEVGGVAGLGEAALGAYREMANAAILLDRPDILYSLMMLSVSLPIWATSTNRDLYSASCLLGQSESTEEIKKALKPHLKKLIPRLLRACHDPNKQTRDQMLSLWNGVTGGGSEARALISTHLLSTIDSLMKDATNKLWRARVGACRALAECIVGRSWNELGGGGPILLDDYTDEEINLTAASRLLLLFRVTVRSLDDVKLPVRESGETLSRSLKSLTLRICDDSTINSEALSPFSQDDTSSSVSAAATILPWLLKFGLNSPCDEAKGFTVSCLLGIVEVAKPSTLETVLPELIGSLLMAMSGLEPSALNYLQTRAAGSDSNRFEQLERIRLQMAQQGPLSGALNKCLEMVKSIESDSQKSAVIPEIDTALRCGAGFATRAAAADAVSTLCISTPEAFTKFTGSSTSNPTVRLLRALYYASEREQGSGARGKMTHAFGNLAALAPSASVRSLALRLLRRYERATGANDDPTARTAAAAGLRAISVRASNQFSDGGPKDIWMKRVLPIAYLGRSDKEAGKLFQEVWDEGGNVANLYNNNAFAMQLEEKMLSNITVSLISALNDVSWDRRVMACKSLNELCQKNILSPAPKPANIDSYSKDDFSKRELERATSSKGILSVCVNLIVNSRVWTGKSDLIKTTSLIAGNWVSQSSSIELTPILLDHFIWNDLLKGDSWFEKNDINIEPQDNNMDVDSEPSGSNTDSDEVKKDTTLNVTEDDDENSENDDNDDECDMGVSTSQPITFSGLCRLLLEQGVKPTPLTSGNFYSNDALPYRAASLVALSKLLKKCTDTRMLEYLYKKMAVPLISTFDLEMFQHDDDSQKYKVAPSPIIVGSIDCLGSLIWQGIQYDGKNIFTQVHSLVKLFLRNCGESQASWTIREASAVATSKLVSNADVLELQKVDVVNSLVLCSSFCADDRKFSQVRVAKQKILCCLCNRAKATQFSTDNEKQLMLEALLPLKEKILSMANKSLSDNESDVTALASKIIAAMAWWP